MVGKVVQTWKSVQKRKFVQILKFGRMQMVVWVVQKQNWFVQKLKAALQAEMFVQKLKAVLQAEMFVQMQMVVKVVQMR